MLLPSISSLHWGENEVEHGPAHQAVSNLLKPCKNKNQHVYFDNFCTTKQLLIGLEKENAFAYGMITSDRSKFPESLKNND